MAEVLSPIILVAPTTVGKTEVALAIADKVDATLINSDKYGLYADGNYFEVGLGLAPNDLQDGRSRQLYGCLDPHAPLPSPEEYVQLADEAVATAHAAGKVAVIEGCSYRNNQALIGHFGVKHAVNLALTQRDGVEELVVQRAIDAIRWGLYGETERALAAGYGDTYPMTGMFYRPARRVLNGEISETEALDLIRANAKDNVLEHDTRYSETPGLLRIGHQRKQPIPTAEIILAAFANR